MISSFIELYIADAESLMFSLRMNICEAQPDLLAREPRYRVLTHIVENTDIVALVS